MDEAGYLLGVSLFYSGNWSASLSEFSLAGIRHPKSPFIGRARVLDRRREPQAGQLPDGVRQPHRVPGGRGRQPCIPRERPAGTGPWRSKGSDGTGKRRRASTRSFVIPRQPNMPPK